MFEAFAQAFGRPDVDDVLGQGLPDERWEAIDGYREFYPAFGGRTFERGLYRTHGEADAILGLQMLREAFPAAAARLAPFAYDWLGRQFAIDFGRLRADEPLILLCEPGTGNALQIPLTFREFHEQLDELREPALADSFFREWAQANSMTLPLKRRQVVGYEVPLFLGGKDVASNLEVTDFEVYWSFAGQLLTQLAGR